jgi:predicted restriction endonuclease
MCKSELDHHVRLEDLELLHEFSNECVKVVHIKLVEASMTEAAQEVVLLCDNKCEMIDKGLVPVIESVAEVVLELGNKQFLEVG